MTPLTLTYIKMKDDREKDERERKYRRVRDIKDDKKWEEEMKAMVREERQQAARTYTQPVQIAYLDWMHWAGYKQADLDEMSDEQAFLEWQIYNLRVKYGVLV